MGVFEKNTYLLFAYFTIFIVVIFPDFLPIFFIKKGQAWTALNDFNYRTSDLYYYAYGIKEVIRGNWLISQVDGSLSCEAARIVPYWLASIPFFCFPFDVAIPFSIGLSAVLVMWIISLILQKFDVSKEKSFFISFVFLFYLGVWSSIPTVNSSYLYESINASIKNLLNISDYDHFNSNFRIVALSMANVVLFLQIFFGICSYQKDKIIFYFLFFALSVSLCFTYPTFLMIGCFVILSLFCLSAICKNTEKAFIFFIIGLIILSILGLLWYTSFFQRTYGNSHILENVYGDFNKGISFKSIYEINIKELVLNKYSISFLCLLIFLKKDKHSRFFIILNGFFLIFISLIFCTNSSLLLSRMTVRGIDIPWFLSMIYGIERFLFFYSEQKLNPVLSKILKVLKNFILLCLFIGPLIGFLRFSMNNIENNSRYYPDTQKELINWVVENAKKNDVVAALDLSDAHFLTFSSGHFVNYIGYVDIQKLTLEENFERFINVACLSGMKEEDFKNLINDFVPFMHQRITDGWAQRRNPPFLKNPHDYQSSQVAFMLLYWPYVKSVWGIEISTENQQTNPLLVHKIHAMFLEKKNAKSTNIPVTYLIVSKALYAPLIEDLKKMYPLSYENSHGAIFWVKKV